MLTFPNVAIVNDQSSGLADPDVDACVKALAAQLNQDFGPVWHTGAHLHHIPAGQKPPAGMWVIALLGNSDQAGALGYHDLTPDGLPLGKVFAATDRQIGAKWTVTLDHELLEMLADPWIDTVVQADSGTFYALEVCDPVEADGLGYQKNGIALSDFVTPHWFGHGAGGMDFLGHVKQPLELAPGGYISSFDPSSGMGWQQLQAQHAEPVGPEVLAAAVPRVGSRRERRFRGSAGWNLSTYATA